MRFPRFLGVLFILALAASAQAAVPPDTATPTPTVTQTATPTPTITPTSTITPLPVLVVRPNHNRFNPMLGETVSVLNLRPDHGQVTIRVLDLSGAVIRVLLDGEAVPAQAPVWDGRNAQGETVASGVYVIVAAGNKLHKRFRVAVIK